MRFNFFRTRVRSLVMLVTNSLTNSLTDSCLVNLIDVTLACEDANSKLVDVVAVMLGSICCGFRSWGLVRLWAQGLVNILNLKFRQDFYAGICSVFCWWCFVEVMKLKLGRDSKLQLQSWFIFIYQSSCTNFDQISSPESRPSFNFITSTKHQQQNTDQNSASKSRLSFNLDQTLCSKSEQKFNFMTKTSASKSATNCPQHVSKHQHQQQSQPQQVLCGIFTCQGPINQVYLTGFI